MFVAYGITAADDRIAAYLSTLRGVPDRYFREAIDKAMRDCTSGFPPSPGEVYAASVALNHANAERVASEPARLESRAITSGRIEFNPWRRHVQNPDRSIALPSGTASKFDSIHKARMKVYVDAAWSEVDGAGGTAREKIKKFHELADCAWELACIDIASEHSDIGEFARRAWARHADECRHRREM